MAYKFGALTGQDVSDYTLISTVGQGVVYEDLMAYMQERNAEIQSALSVFVEMTTDLYTERYKLPGGGRLQKRGRQSGVAEAKAGGYWDTAYPLEDFAAALAWNDVDMAYMSINEFNTHISTIEEQDRNTVRYEMLKALLNSSARTYTDERHGSITVQPLANADSVLYPPVLGSESEATESHYLESGYAAASISNTNNPVATIVAELAEHFGDRTGGDNIAVFVNNAQDAQLSALSAFDAVPDAFIRTGANRDVPINLPSVPGKIIGRLSGAWVINWRWMPTNYLFGVHLEQPAPLKMRVDPASTGLGQGLQLVTTDKLFPFTKATWRHRFGFGAGNRLNGVALELGTGGTYTVPSDYA